MYVALPVAQSEQATGAPRTPGWAATWHNQSKVLERQGRPAERLRSHCM